jgi:hypothetical protein
VEPPKEDEDFRAGIPLTKTGCYLNDHAEKENGIYDLERLSFVDPQR